MKLLKWFYPGMKIKRWMALAIFGVIMLSMGFVVIIAEEKGKASFGTSLIIIIGIIAIITGVKKIINSLITIFMPKGEKDLVDIVYSKRQLERGARIVVIGGGSGLSTVLHGLKEYTNNITAIVTAVDEGRYASGIQDHFNMPKPTDVRESLIALADAEPVVGKLFNYRFKKGTELWGYNFGDLFLAAMSEVMGNFDRAVKESSKVLAVRGQVVPSTLEKVSLIAHHEDGTETVGRQNILSSMSPIKKVYLRPHAARATQEALNAVSKADAIIIGPGGLYTDIMPGLLVGGMKEALAVSRAAKIFVMNIMTKPDETENYKASDHLRAVTEHLGSDLMDYCLVNNSQIPYEQLNRYEQEDSCVVALDKEAVLSMGIKIVEDSMVDKNSSSIRHDPLKLANIALELIAESKKARPHVK